jgi:curved DNA-binding protein CbpA
VRDPREVLGVPGGASREEVRRAYRTLARRHHPDANPDDPQAEERFKEIQQAYEALTSPPKRTAGATRSPRPAGGATGARARGLEELLNRLGATGSGRERVLRLLGENLKVDVKVSFGEKGSRDGRDRREPEGEGKG